MEEVIMAIVSLVIGGGLIAYWRGVALLKKRQFLDAGSDFRTAFKDEILFLKTYRPTKIGEMGRVIVTLKNALDKHEAAVINFIEYLSKRQRRTLERAWKKYIGETDQQQEEENRLWIYYNPTHSEGDFENYAENMKKKEQEIIALALNNIKKMLEFSKPR